MIADTRVFGGLPLAGKVLGAVLLALFLSAVAVIAGPAVARAAAPAPTVEYSSDNGVTWGGTKEIQWAPGDLVPGQELKTTLPNACNASGVDGFVGAVGQYTLTSGMIATARVDIDGQTGNPVTLTEARLVVPGTPVGPVHLAAGGVATVDLVVGMRADAGNGAQSRNLNLLWLWASSPARCPNLVVSAPVYSAPSAACSLASWSQRPDPLQAAFARCLMPARSVLVAQKRRDAGCSPFLGEQPAPHGVRDPGVLGPVPRAVSTRFPVWGRGAGDQGHRPGGGTAGGPALWGLVGCLFQADPEVGKVRRVRLSDDARCLK